MPTGIYTRTESHCKAMSEAHKGIPSPMKGLAGKKHSEYTKRKMSLSHIGISNKGWKMSTEGRENMSRVAKTNGFGKWMKGKKLTLETRSTMSESAKRKPLMSIVTRLKLSEANKGVKSWRWKGGLTSINKAIRNGLEFKLWRESVFARDNWTCQDCKERGGELHPHHIKPFALFPELRFAIDNGLTLCKECHKKTETYGGKIHAHKLQKAYEKII